MRPLVITIAVACAGCSLFLLDGLNGNAAPAVDEGGAPDAASEASPTSNDAATSDAADDTSVPTTDTYAAAITTDAPIGWWRLDDAPGSTKAKDSTGKSVDATLVGAGGVVLAQPGAMKQSKAFVLDGSAYLDLGDRFDFVTPSEYTIEAWVKPALPQADDGFHGVLTKITYGAAHTENGRWLYYSQSFPRIALEEWNTTSAFIAAGASKVLPQDRFSHVVATFDGTVARFYLDGALQQTFTSMGALADNTVVCKWGEGWIGALDELAIYDKPLDAARVLAHYQAGAAN